MASIVWAMIIQVLLYSNSFDASNVAARASLVNQTPNLKKKSHSESPSESATVPQNTKQQLWFPRRNLQGVGYPTVNIWQNGTLTDTATSPEATNLVKDPLEQNNGLSFTAILGLNPFTKGSAITTNVQIKVTYKASILLSGYRFGCPGQGFPMAWSVHNEFRELHQKSSLTVCDPNLTYSLEDTGQTDANDLSHSFWFVFTNVAASSNFLDSVTGNARTDILQMSHIKLYPDRIYGLMKGEWGECSVECEGGTQTRNVDCADIYTGAPRNYRFCNYQSEEDFAHLKEQICNPQPCKCIGLCLESAVCGSSHTLMPQVGCDKLSDKKQATAFYAKNHADGNYAQFNTLTSGVIDWVAFKPYYSGGLASSYLMVAGSEIAKMPSAWKLYAGKKQDLNNLEPTTKKDFTDLTLIDFRYNINWNQAGQVQIFDIPGTVDGINVLSNGTITNDINTVSGLVLVNDQSELEDEASAWQYYRINFLAVNGETFDLNKDKLQQTQSVNFPVQIALSEFDIFPHGVTFTLTLGNWGICSKICGGGQQERLVTCQGSDGQTYQLYRCPTYNSLTDVSSQPCNTHPCPPPGEIQQIEILETTRYDHLNFKVSISSPGGTLQCGAFTHDQNRPDEQQGQWPIHAQTNETAQQYMEENQDNEEFKMKFSQACADPECEGKLKHIPGNTTLRVFCGVNDIADTLHVQWSRDIISHRGPQLQQIPEISGTGCYKVHLVRPDLPERQFGLIGSGHEAGTNYDQGDCSQACSDSHYFSLQQNGQCFCGNSSDRKYGKGRYKNSMTLGCNCDGPEYGWNVQCVWQQIPPLIREELSGRTEIYATLIRLGLDLDVMEMQYSYGFNGSAEIQCEIDNIVDPITNTIQTMQQLQQTQSQSTVVTTLVTPQDAQNSNCILEFGKTSGLTPNMIYNFKCRGLDRPDSASRHVRQYQIRTNQVALMMEPKFGTTNKDYGFMETSIRNMDVRSIRYRCHARLETDPDNLYIDNINKISASIISSEWSWCEVSKDCHTTLQGLLHKSVYEVSCHVTSGSITIEISPTQNPNQPFARKKYTTLAFDSWYPGKNDQQQEETPVPTAAVYPNNFSNMNRVSASDSDEITSGFIVLQIFIGLVLVTAGVSFLPSMRDSIGPRRYHRRQLIQRGNQWGKHGYPLYIFPISICYVFSSTEDDQLLIAFAAKRWYRRILTITQDSSMIIFSILLMSVDEEHGVQMHLPAIVNSFISSVMLILFTHGVMSRVCQSLDLVQPIDGNSGVSGLSSQGGFTIRIQEGPGAVIRDIQELRQNNNSNQQESESGGQVPGPGGSGSGLRPTRNNSPKGRSNIPKLSLKQKNDQSPYMPQRDQDLDDVSDVNDAESTITEPLEISAPITQTGPSQQRGTRDSSQKVRSSSNNNQQRAPSLGGNISNNFSPSSAGSLRNTTNNSRLNLNFNVQQSNIDEMRALRAKSQVKSSSPISVPRRPQKIGASTSYNNNSPMAAAGRSPIGPGGSGSKNSSGGGGPGSGRVL